MPAPKADDKTVSLPISGKRSAYMRFPWRLRHLRELILRKAKYELKDSSGWPSPLTLDVDAKGNPILKGTPDTVVQPGLPFTVIAVVDDAERAEATFVLEVDEPPAINSRPTQRIIQLS